MTNVPDGPQPIDSGLAVSREEARRRLEEIMASRGAGGRKPSSKRSRTVLVIVLVLLLLLLAGLGWFLYRLLAPSAEDVGADDLSKTGGIIWIRSIYGTGPSEDEFFVNPNDAVTGADGLIWITDAAHSRVAGFRSDGSYVRAVQGSQQTGQPFRLPFKVAVDADGIMYIVDRANEALTIMDGQTVLVSTNIPGISAIDVNDQIIVAGSTSGFAILDKDGNVQRILGTRGQGADQFDRVSGVALDSDAETIYVVDTFNNRLSAWDFAGNRKWIQTLGNPANRVVLQGGASLATTSSAPAALQLPVDVTVDGNGRPMVLDGFDFSISAFNPKTGDFIAKWGMWGEEDGQLMYPNGLEYDPSKDWFTIADTGNRRAQIVRIPGTGGGASSWLSRLLSGPLRALLPACASLLLFLLLYLAYRWRRRRQERQKIQERTTILTEAIDVRGEDVGETGSDADAPQPVEKA